MSKSYDLIVIGSGTAAMVATSRAAAAGWKVGVTDFRPFGGTCALRGCDPKKMLVTGAQVMDDIRRMATRGVVAPDARVVGKGVFENGHQSVALTSGAASDVYTLWITQPPPTRPFWPAMGRTFPRPLCCTAWVRPWEGLPACYQSQ